MLTKIISVRRPSKKAGRTWETVPGAGKVVVLDTVAGTMTDPTTSLSENVIGFHIGFMQGIFRGCRVLYLGKDYEVRRVSDSSRLRGLEVLCAACIVAPA